MSIQVSAADTLIEHSRGETKEPETPNCPVCVRLLWSHGTRFRVCKSLELCAVLKIKRWLCPNCSKTFSLLPAFIEEYKRFERRVRESYVVAYCSEKLTYRELAWKDSEQDDAEASLSRGFRAVGEAASESQEMLLAVQEHLVKAGVATESVPFVEESAPAETKEGAKQKPQQLSYLRRLFCLLRHFFGGSERAICAAYRSLCLGFRLPTPHTLQQALF